MGDRRFALSEGRFRALARATADIVWTGTPDGNQVNDLPEWRAFTGQTREQIEGFGWANAIHPDDRERTVRAWRQAVLTGEKFELEHRLRRQDGVYRTMHVRALPVRGDAGNILEWVGMHADITERSELEESLRRQKRDLKEAYRLARLGSWWWDVATNTVTWTEEVYRVFERDPKLPPPSYEELRQYHTPASRALLSEAVAKALESGESYAIDLELEMMDGRRKWIAARGEVEVFDGGKPSRLRGTIQDITERKEILHAEQKANQTLESVLASITDGLAVLDKEWRYTYFSKQGGRMLGLRPDEVIGKRLWDLFPHAEKSKFGEGYRRAITTGEPVHFDEFYPEPLNKWIESHCYPSADGLSVYFRDITARRQSGQALRASEERFRKLFESDLMGIAIPDRFGAFLEGNDEFLRIVGYSRNDLEAGRVRWDTMTPPEYAELDALHIAEAAQRGSCTPYEKEYIRKTGDRVAILCGYALLENTQDTYIGFVQDLTLQKQTEEALRKSEHGFRVLAESLPQLIWVTNPNGGNEYANQRFLDYAGLSQEDFSRGAWQTLFHPEDADRTARNWERSIATGEPYSGEFRYRRHDGMYRWFLGRAVPVRNEAGEVERWLGSSTDIHDQKLAEEALRRTEKLAATGRLAASVAHEINNPLTSVTNSIYLALQDETLSEATRSWLRLADKELVRVAHVATQTLRFFRQSTAPTLVDVSRAMDSVLELFASRLKALQIEIVLEYRTEQKLFCFSDELRQVFANLVGNALDAVGEEGRLRIRICSDRAWGGADQRGVVATIADNGCGIPSAVRKQVFEPFVSTKDDTGTGLGLWVSQGIVRKHQGLIAVRSSTRAGRRGTVFSVFLPFDGLAEQRHSEDEENTAP